MSTVTINVAVLLAALSQKAAFTYGEETRYCKPTHTIDVRKLLDPDLQTGKIRQFVAARSALWFLVAAADPPNGGIPAYVVLRTDGEGKLLSKFRLPEGRRFTQWLMVDGQNQLHAVERFARHEHRLLTFDAGGNLLKITAIDTPVFDVGLVDDSFIGVSPQAGFRQLPPFQLKSTLFKSIPAKHLRPPFLIRYLNGGKILSANLVDGEIAVLDLVAGTVDTTVTQLIENNPAFLSARSRLSDATKSATILGLCGDQAGNIYVALTGYSIVRDGAVALHIAPSKTVRIVKFELPSFEDLKNTATPHGRMFPSKLESDGKTLYWASFGGLKVAAYHLD